MAILNRYVEFGNQAAPDTEDVGDALEEVKLDAFESGYQAGWDDAVNAHAAEADKISSQLNQRLEDMSFTYLEVQTKMALALKPLMVGCVTKLLPGIAAKSLHAHILQEIGTLIDTMSGNAVEIAVSPDHKAALNDILQDRISLPFQITSDTALTSGQVYVRAGEAEREINLDAVLKGIAEAVEAYFEQVNPETPNE